MKFKQFTASILLLAVFLNLLLLPVQAQVGDPIEITFGQPNIWSLEQAHYLLSQMRERSMRIRANELQNLDPNSAEASRINLVRQMFGLNSEFTQRPDFGDAKPTTSPSATPTPSPAPFPSPAAAPSPLDGTIISKLLDSNFLSKLNSDSKLNATTRLDNHIQLQYEIISKQLTLLRDEVGPDERLVFLELPQTIYASAHDTKGKVVQTYWEIAGYSEYSKETDLAESIKEIEGYHKDLKKAYEDADKKFNESFLSYKTLLDNSDKSEANYEDTANACAEDKVCTEKKKTDLEAERKKLSAFENAIENKEKIASVKDLKAEYQEKKRTFAQIDKELQRLRAQLGDVQYDESVNKARDAIERIKQGGAVPSNKIVKRVIDKNKFDSSEFNKDEIALKNDEHLINLNRRTRTVDIIPRQSSLNVNDIQETVKSSILGGAFSFLFGLGLRTNFQRQRDTFEQYLHQETYASGFGKGGNIFGWTFGPVPGTKRIASGIRTTYAVVVAPRSAEALVLNARGCYFSRKKFQPQDVMAANKYNNQDWTDDDDRECNEKKQQFILPIPNGGDARGFWLTEMDYSPVKKGNQRLVASINGRNFTQQVGVLIDGVPLQQVVELTRKLPSRDLLDEFCRSGICGAYEVIDSDEITIAFQMPESYIGTPEITVIGPGRSVSVNRLRLSRIKVGDKRFPNASLTDENIPQMFGGKPKTFLAINDLTVLSQVPATTTAPSTVTALLTGSKFENGSDDIYVNGISANKNFLSAENYTLTFPLPNSDSFTVMVRRCIDKDGKAKSQATCITSGAGKDSYEVSVKSFPIAAAQFAITNVVALSYDQEKEVMFIRVEGIGLSRATLSKVNENATLSGSTQIPVSSRELLIKIASPEPMVKITLVNPNGKEVSAVVPRPIDERLLRQEQPE